MHVPVAADDAVAFICDDPRPHFFVSHTWDILHYWSHGCVEHLQAHVGFGAGDAPECGSGFVAGRREAARIAPGLNLLVLESAMLVMHFWLGGLCERRSYVPAMAVGSLEQS